MGTLRYFESHTIDRVISAATVIVFDLNGLLVDDEMIQLAATNAALGIQGVSISLDQWEAQCVGRSAYEYLSEFCPGITRERIDHVLNVKNEAYERLLLGSTVVRWKPGVVDFLSWNRASNRQCALATSTTRANFEILDRILGLRKKVELRCIVCGDEVERAKPDPSIYSKVRERLGESERYIVLEDSTNGLRSAVAAAMPCIVVPSLPGQPLSDFRGSVLIIDSLRAEARVLGGARAGPE
jgi:beta-phosphoglucomutase-like phosphatase (HAD superfamily)